MLLYFMETQIKDDRTNTTTRLDGYPKMKDISTQSRFLNQVDNTDTLFNSTCTPFINLVDILTLIYFFELAYYLNDDDSKILEDKNITL